MSTSKTPLSTMEGESSMLSGRTRTNQPKASVHNAVKPLNPAKQTSKDCFNCQYAPKRQHRCSTTNPKACAIPNLRVKKFMTTGPTLPPNPFARQKYPIPITPAIHVAKAFILCDDETEALSLLRECYTANTNMNSHWAQPITLCEENSEKAIPGITLTADENGVPTMEVGTWKALGQEGYEGTELHVCCMKKTKTLRRKRTGRTHSELCFEEVGKECKECLVKRVERMNERFRTGIFETKIDVVRVGILEEMENVERKALEGDKVEGVEEFKTCRSKVTATIKVKVCAQKEETTVVKVCEKKFEEPKCVLTVDACQAKGMISSVVSYAVELGWYAVDMGWYLVRKVKDNVQVVGDVLYQQFLGFDF